MAYIEKAPELGRYKAVRCIRVWSLKAEGNILQLLLQEEQDQRNLVMILNCMGPVHPGVEPC